MNRNKKVVIVNLSYDEAERNKSYIVPEDQIDVSIAEKIVNASNSGNNKEWVKLTETVATITKKFEESSVPIGTSRDVSDYNVTRILNITMYAY